MPRPDAIVVGSGPNGLAAAITLAEAGRSVLVLEAAPRPGGAVATAELTLPGFRHDVFSAVYPAAAASPAFARMGLERHGLRWVHPRRCLAHVRDDGRAVLLSRDVAETAAGLDALQRGDGARWAAFVAPLLRSPGALRRTLLGAFPPLPGPAELALRRGPRPLLELARVALMSASDLAGELFAGADARAWLLGTALHGDVPTQGAGSAVVALQLHLLGHLAGWPSPQGGAGSLTDALCARLRELGGSVRTDAPVARLATRSGAVAAVELGDGERLATRLVVLDLVPRGVLELAGPELPERYADALRRYRHGPATLKVDWALSGPIPWSAAAARAAGTVHIGGEGPDGPFLIAGQQSVADPTRAPAGRHTAWAYTRGRELAGADGERWAQRIEEQIERFAPGFRARILARCVLAPDELERRNRNLVGGDVGGGSYALDQLFFRPLPSLVPYRTPIRGVYLGSAATFPGGGVHGVSGRAAARWALVDARLRPR